MRTGVWLSVDDLEVIFHHQNLFEPINAVVIRPRMQGLITRSSSIATRGTEHLMLCPVRLNETGFPKAVLDTTSGSLGALISRLSSLIDSVIAL